MADKLQKEYADLYQPLFDLMFNEHGVILTITEMDEIIKVSFQVYNNVDKFLNQ